MKIQKSIFPEILIIEPDVFKDNRGYFFESYSLKKYEELGIEEKFIQDNHSYSIKDTIRGLHFCIYPSQKKLVRCSRGKILDVVVDIRPESPTFKKWISIELSAENFLQLYIPEGFAHGFKVLSEIAEIQYKVSSYYNPEIERGIIWNDPDIGVEWNCNNPILSKRDNNLPTLVEFLRKYPNPFEKNNL